MEAPGGTLSTEWWPVGGEMFRVVPIPKAEGRLGGHRNMPCKGARIQDW